MEKSRSASSARASSQRKRPTGSGGRGSSPVDVRLALVEQVAKFAERERMCRGSRKVMAAVSGGPDSVAMLLVLLDLRERFGFELAAAHFDHQLRPNSRRDLEWVRDLCKTLEVP